MTGKLMLMAGAGLLLCACTSTRTGGNQGQTHWLQSCEKDADCGELSCLCGFCVSECAAGGSCSVEGRDTECFAANANAVRALCEAPQAQPLCLEPCDGECSAGQRCVDGACIADEPEAPRAGMSGGGTAGFGGTAGTSSEPGPEATPAKIVLYNATDRPYFLHTGANCAGIKDWFRVLEDGTRVEIEGNCTTDCATYDPSKGPVGCPAICRADEYATLQPGAGVTYDWDGAGWENDPRGCQARIPIPTGTELELQFCWLDMAPAGDPFPGPPAPGSVHCESMQVVHGEQSTLRYEIRNP